MFVSRALTSGEGVGLLGFLWNKVGNPLKTLNEGNRHRNKYIECVRENKKIYREKYT